MWSRSLLASSALRAARPATSAFRGPNPFLLTAAQRRLLSDQTRQAIDKAVASAPVVLFMKGTPETPQCGFSRASIQFAAFNVLEDAELRSGIKEYSDWPTIPQLYVDKEFVGGCDIVVSMHQNGDLAKLLEEKKVLAEGEGEGKDE
ncbi:Monothiol glutaredoxin-5 like protein [Verticillium longisporum]|nr:Monothiol glutaredoxin-5 like protein [Verticillium longisporum]